MYNSGLVQKLATILASTDFYAGYICGMGTKIQRRILKTKGLGHIDVDLRFCGMNNWCFGYLAGK